MKTKLALKLRWRAVLTRFLSCTLPAGAAIALAVTTSLAQAQQACPANWREGFSAKATQILELLANSEFKRNHLFDLANCTRRAVMDIDIGTARDEDPTKLARVLKETSDIQRSLRDKFARSKVYVSADYWQEREVDFRGWYLQEINRPPGGVPADGPLRNTYLEGTHFLVDGLNHLDDAQPIAAALQEAGVEPLWPETYGIWIRALASCPDWKFQTAANATDGDLKRNLCSAECRSIVRNAFDPIQRESLSTRAKKDVMFQTLWPRVKAATVNCGG